MCVHVCVCVRVCDYWGKVVVAIVPTKMNRSYSCRSRDCLIANGRHGNHTLSSSMLTALLSEYDKQHKKALCEMLPLLLYPIFFLLLATPLFAFAVGEIVPT